MKPEISWLGAGATAERIEFQTTHDRLRSVHEGAATNDLPPGVMTQEL